MASTNDVLKAFRAAPKLSKETLSRWPKFVLMILQNFGLEDLINQDVPESGPSTSANNDSKESSNVMTTNHDLSIRVALTSIIPQKYYHLIEDRSTAKSMWDALQDYFKPKTEDGVLIHLKAFYRFTMLDDTSVDKFAEGLAELQRRISIVDSFLTPPDHIMRNYLLDHFDSACNGYFSGSVTSLRKDKSCSFIQAVNSLQTT